MRKTKNIYNEFLESVSENNKIIYSAVVFESRKLKRGVSKLKLWTMYVVSNIVLTVLLSITFIIILLFLNLLNDNGIYLTSIAAVISIYISRSITRYITQTFYQRFYSGMLTLIALTEDLIIHSYVISESQDYNKTEKYSLIKDYSYTIRYGELVLYGKSGYEEKAFIKDIYVPFNNNSYDIYSIKNIIIKNETYKTLLEKDDNILEVYKVGDYIEK